MSLKKINWEKYIKTLERKEKILLWNQNFIENRDELLIYLERFIILEKKLLQEKWWKLIDKNEDCLKMIWNLDNLLEILWNDNYKEFLSIS